MKYHHRWSPGDALYRACRTGNEDLMKTTLRKGADVNAVDDSAAMAAIAGGGESRTAAAAEKTSLLLRSCSRPAAVTPSW